MRNFLSEIWVDPAPGNEWKHIINPYLTNGFSHHYHLGESIVIFRDVWSDFKVLFNFSMKILKANRIAPDRMQRSAASQLGLFCLHVP